MRDDDVTASARTPPIASWGRYVSLGEIASGGMATVEYGRLVGPLGFTRSVAIKRLHAHFARDPDLVSMFIDEARLCARLNHANVIPTLDIVEGPGELALIMEYVHGESLCTLLELASTQRQQVPARVATALIAAVLHGLHAAHEARDEHARPLGIVHRDVSPQNVLVGADGVPRVLDFGIAKAMGRLRSTPSGEIKGKLAYIAPEQLRGAEVDRRTDVYGASAVLWEVLTGRQLFDGPSESAVLRAVLEQPVQRPSAVRPELPPGLDEIVLRGLSRVVADRFETARDMALGLERTGMATQSEVHDWLHGLAGERLAARAAHLEALSRQPAPMAPTAPPPSQARRPYLIALAAFALALAGTVALTLRGDDAFVVRPRPSAPATAPTVAPERNATLHSAPSTRPAAASGDSQPLPVKAAAATAPAAAATPLAVQRPDKARHRLRAAPAEDCTPPYRVDRTGVRHPKPECL
jgi:serine/threonine-protein kinase